MRNDEIESIEAELKTWEKHNRIAGQWLLLHDLYDENWETISRNRRNAQIKIAQLKQRLHYKPIDRPDTVSIPKFNHYDTAN